MPAGWGAQTAGIPPALGAPGGGRPAAAGGPPLALHGDVPILSFVPNSFERLDDDPNAFREVLKVLDRLPFVSSVKRDIQSLRDLIYNRRAPRVMAIARDEMQGRALANALLGKRALLDDTEPYRWVRIDADGALLDWLSVPVGGEDATEQLARAFDDSVPDIALILASPADLDGRLEGVVTAIRRVQTRLSKPAEQTIALLTETDAVPPPRARPPYPEEKSHAIELLREKLGRILREGEIETHAVLAVSAHDGNGIERLSEMLVEILPDRARVESARAFVLASRGRREVANRIVHSSSTLALTVGMAPIPFSDAFVIAPLQVTMVSSIAHLAGRPWDRRAFGEWVASMGIVGGAGMGLRWTARQLLKVIPGAGTLVSAGVAGAGTVSMGQSAIAYFLRGEPKQLTAG